MSFADGSSKFVGLFMNKQVR